MTEEVKNCPLCQSEKNSLFDRRQFRGHQVVNRLCGNCGLVFQSPRMTAGELNDFYASEYRQVYQGEAGPTQKDLFVQNGRAESLLEFISQYQVNPTKYLDIGCSSGTLLKRLQDWFKCEAVGVEPGEAYREYASSQGLTVYADLSDIDENSEFDLISMAHVLEHLAAPVEYLAEIRKEYLTPSGWLLIEEPNLYSHDSFEIAHMTSFSAHTLSEVFRKAGYEVVAIKKHGQPRSKLLPLYLTILAKPQEGFKDYEVRVERFVSVKRQLGMLWRRLLQKLFPHLAWVPIK